MVKLDGRFVSGAGDRGHYDNLYVSAFGGRLCFGVGCEWRGVAMVLGVVVGCRVALC